VVADREAAPVRKQRIRVRAEEPSEVRRVLERGVEVDVVRDLERQGGGGLCPRDARPALVAAYGRALADARRLQAALAGADPMETMSPLQIGPSGGRRTVERARLLLRRACG